MSNLDLFLAPIIGAIIGWFTNYLAVRMLFHPQLPTFIFGYNIQGVFPKRQKDLAIKLGELVSRELISNQEIKNIIKEQLSEEKLKFYLEQAVDRIIAEKLGSISPMLSMFLAPELIDKIKESFVTEILNVRLELLSQSEKMIDQKYDVQKLVEDKITNFSPQKVEQLILEIMSKELRFVELSGAVLGFIIGFSQVLLKFILNN